MRVHMYSSALQDLLAGTDEFDASGNPKLADIGLHIRKLLKSHFDRVDVKYIDPTYMIRAIVTTSQDRIYCRILAHNAVHGAFAGLTGPSPVRPPAPSARLQMHPCFPCAPALVHQLRQSCRETTCCSWRSFVIRVAAFRHRAQCLQQRAGSDRGFAMTRSARALRTLQIPGLAELA